MAPAPPHDRCWRETCYTPLMENGTKPPSVGGAGTIIKGALLGGGLLLASQILWAIAFALLAIWMLGALLLVIVWTLVALLAAILPL